MIHIQSALQNEARPIINHYQLGRLSGSTMFESYVNEEKTISLTISGIGKLSAAAAVMYTGHLFPEAVNRGWLNIGIAGHQSLNTCTPVLANRITDAGSLQCWYPQIVFGNGLNNCPLLTVDMPTDEYPDNCMVDMESSGYYSAASRTDSCELIHCLKIISDNKTDHYRQIDKNKIENLIQQNQDAIDLLVKNLQSLVQELPQADYDKNLFEAFTARLHFTHSQQLQLIKTLTRWKLLCPESTPDMDDCFRRKNAKQLIDYLAKQLDGYPIRF